MRYEWLVNDEGKQYVGHPEYYVVLDNETDGDITFMFFQYGMEPRRLTFDKGFFNKEHLMSVYCSQFNYTPQSESQYIWWLYEREGMVPSWMERPPA